MSKKRTDQENRRHRRLRNNGRAGRRSGRHAPAAPDMDVALERTVRLVQLHPKVTRVWFQGRVAGSSAGRPVAGSLTVRKTESRAVLVDGFDRQGTLRMRVETDVPEMVAEYVRRRSGR